MEGEDSDALYTEALVRLPNTSVYYEYLDLPIATMTRLAMNVPKDRFAFWCGQSLYKYQPLHDEIFAKIASIAPSSFFVFIDFNSCEVTNIFKKRLDQSFDALGLDMKNFCVFLPRLSPESFLAAAGRCDAVLDSIGWAGFNSTLEAIAHDLPIVTYRGSLMRGRHGVAIMTCMGLAESIAQSPEAYVEAAARLVNDAVYRDSIKTRIASSKDVLFRDDASVMTLSEFLRTAVRVRQSVDLPTQLDRTAKDSE